MSFRDRLKIAVERVGSAAEISRRAGIPARTISNYMTGHTPEPPGSICAKLAAAAGVRAEWLFAGVEPMTYDFSGPGFAVEVKSGNKPGDASAGSKRYAYIPMFNVSAGASRGGRQVLEERVIGELAFQEDWIRQEIRVKPEDLRLIHVEGDSMEPDLRAGDIVLLDTTDTLARREGIYVIRMDGALLVKSLQRLPGGVVKVVSRNPAYDSFTVTVADVEHPNGFGVIGRVVWACRRF